MSTQNQANDPNFHLCVTSPCLLPRYEMCTMGVLEPIMRNQGWAAMQSEIYAILMDKSHHLPQEKMALKLRHLEATFWWKQGQTSLVFELLISFQWRDEYLKFSSSCWRQVISPKGDHPKMWFLEWTDIGLIEMTFALAWEKYSIHTCRKGLNLCSCHCFLTCQC